jgi:hypothetical protein
MQPNEARPFATIESALEFMDLLQAAIADTAADVRQDIADAQANSGDRRAEALQLVDYKLQQLSIHVGKSERLLKDLARLRALILCEGNRKSYAVTVAG